MESFQNLVILQNLYRLKSLGYNYTEHINFNEASSYSELSSVDDFSQDIENCHLCDFSKSRNQVMSGFGNQNAELMIIDFSVSSEQDKRDDYYGGRAGEILKNMIENVIKLSVDNVYYTHCIKCKPLNNLSTLTSQWNSCKSYIFSQIDFVKPKVIVTLGYDAYTHLTSDKSNFETLRGHIIDFKKITHVIKRFS